MLISTKKIETFSIVNKTVFQTHILISTKKLCDNDATYTEVSFFFVHAVTL